MLKKYITNIVVVMIFVFLSMILFRKYFFNGYVPFPSNLLVSFYSPWKHEVWEGYPLGPSHKPIGFDNLKLFYPYRIYTTDRLKSGELPLWNPFVFSGNVHLATYQSAVFYPLNFLYLVLPSIDAWSLLVIIQPIIAGYFTYIFLRSLNLGFKAALFGSVVFALSGWMIGWMEESLVIEHSALWLPLVLFGIQKLYKEKINLGFYSILIGFTCSILAGFLQMTVYIGFFSLGFILYKYFSRKEKNKAPLSFFVLAIIGSILLSAVHLIPALVSYFYSPRGVVSAPFLFDAYLMKPWHLLTLLAPDFWGSPGAYNYFGSEGFYHEKIIYIGIPALILVIYMFLQKSNHKYEVFFKWASGISLLLGFVPLGWILYYLSIPIISAMVPSRIFFLSSFSFSILASFGVERFLEDKWDHRAIKKTLFALLSILVLLWIFVLAMKFAPFLDKFEMGQKYGTISLRNLVVPSMLLISCGGLLMLLKNRKRNNPGFYYALLFLTVISSLYFGQKFLYFSERKFVFPNVPALSKLKELAGINRVWAYGNATIEKNMSSYYGLYSSDGYDALYSQRYGELLYIQETKGMYTDQISRTDAQIRPAGESEKFYEDPFRSRLMNLLGVKYILESKKGEGKNVLTTAERFPSESFTLSWEDDKFRIWENKNALPRTFLTTQYIVENNPKKIVAKLVDPDFMPSETIVLENALQLEGCSQGGEGSTLVESYKPENIQITTNTDCDSLLFLSDTYYPGWIARVDSKEVPILRGNYTFRTIQVPKGKHVVEFLYKPREVTVGIYISIVSLFFIYPSLLLLKRRLS